MPEFYIGDRVAESGLISPELRELFAEPTPAGDWAPSDVEWEVRIGDA